MPGSRIGRIMSFGSLAAGLGVGAIAEVTRRGLGLQGDKSGNDYCKTLHQTSIRLCNINENFVFNQVWP